MKKIILLIPLALMLCFMQRAAAQKLTKAEYFYDTDPGVGHGTAATIASPSDSVSLSLSLPIGSLTTGYHYLYFRYQDSLGIWGLPTRTGFSILNNNIDTGAHTSPKVSNAEYFFDNDPGVGNATHIAVTASDSVSVAFNAPVTGLGVGFHYLYTRFEYSNGVWGNNFRQSFYIANTIIDTSRTSSPKISQAEYFIDNDPGQGSGTAVAISTPADSESILFNASVGVVPVGFHYLYARWGYSNGVWGMPTRQSFYVIAANTLTPSPQINYAEYFFDTDPGVGNATQFSVSPATDSANILVNVSTTGLSHGPHDLFFRFRYTNGVWGLYQGGVNGLVTICTPPLDTIRASGPTAYCAGGSVTLKSDTASTWHYQWQRNGTNLAGDTLSTLLVTDSAGVYDVVVTDTGNCPGTSDSITVTIHHSTTNIYSQSICQGQNVSFYGRTLTAGGIYRDTLLNTAGCDSFVVLTLSVLSGLQTNIADSICPGSSYLFKGQSLTTAGTYRDTLTAAGGCDSIVVLTLSFKHVPTVTFNHTICAGSSYNFNGHSYSVAGTYADTVLGSNGCDSITRLVLAVNNAVTVNINHTICSGSSFAFNGQNLSAAGIYRDTTAGTNTCDSITILQLQVQQPVTGVAAGTTCYGTPYAYHGRVFDTAGVYVDTIASVAGCDSIVTLTLTVLPVYADSEAHAICQGSSYNFYGQSLSNAGNYNHTLIAANGCDSVITLALTINALPTVTWAGSADTVCNNGSAVSLSGGLPAGGTYSGTGIFANTFYPDSAGAGSYTITYTYTDGNGCFDNAAKTVVVKVCTGIKTISEGAVSLYPNPATDEVMLQSDAFTNGKTALLLHDVTGKVIEAGYDLNADRIKLHISELAPGMYIVTLKLNGDEVSLRFVKQ